MGGINVARLFSIFSEGAIPINRMPQIPFKKAVSGFTLDECFETQIDKLLL